MEGKRLIEKWCKLIDNDEESCWESGQDLGAESYIEIELKSNGEIEGIVLNSTNSILECAKNLHIMGSYDGITWTTIDYHYGSTQEYIFYDKCDYSHYRLVNVSGDTNGKVGELGILQNCGIGVE